MLEEMFINGKVPREEAIKKLSLQRVQEIEYAQQALKQDITRALTE